MRTENIKFASLSFDSRGSTGPETIVPVDRKSKVLVS